MSAEKIDAVAAAFPVPEFYFSTDAAREAIAPGGMFNVLQTTTGDNVDFWMLTDDPFDRSRFERRHIEPSANPPVPVSTAEDIILAKLHWAMESGGSDRQFRDALGVYEVQAGHLDIAYLTQWAGTLGVSELWERLLREAAGS